jgi:CHAT domain-containing protein/tetratricopeptide (TPR) repeat protein
MGLARIVTVLAVATVVALPSTAAEEAALQSARVLIEQGKYKEGEAAARAALRAAENANGADSLEAAEAILVLVDALVRVGKVSDPETEALAKRAVAIREGRLGPEHPDLAASLQSFGSVYQVRGDFRSAEPLLTRALAIQEKVLGPEDPALALTLATMGSLYNNRGELARARPVLERALAIRKKVLGPEHVHIALSLQQLGQLLHGMGDLAAATQLQEESLAMFERTAGPEHPFVARALTGLAGLLREQAEFPTARPLYERALAMRERVLGPDHPDVAASANNLANLLAEMGEYAEAKRLFERAIAIREKATGAVHPNLRVPLQNLAEVLRSMGDDEASRALLERALAIIRKAYGPAHPAVADTLHHLGVLLADTGDTAGGRALLEESLAIREKVLGPDHAETAISRNDLGKLLVELGEVDAGRQHLEGALRSREAKFGPDHPKVAETLRSLAALRARAGDRAWARPAYERVLAIEEKAFGASHPQVAQARSDLASFLARIGETGSALDAALAAEEVAREHLRTTIRALNERQALLYASARAPGLDVALTLLGGRGQELRGRERDVLDALVRSRAVVLDEMASRHRAVVGADDPRVAPAARTLALARERLARLVVRGGSDDKPAAYRSQLDGARLAKERAEETLASRSLPFREEQARSRIGLAEVAAHVPRGAALVSFARFRVFHAPGQKSPRDAEEGYLAFVLRGGEPAVDAVLLGRGDEIEGHAARWRQQILERAESTGVGARRAAAAYRDSARALRRAIWDPVAPKLAGLTDVYLVPDGVLNLVAFGALSREDGKYLIEDGPVLHYLSAERDLVPAALPPEGMGLLAFGNPAFDAPLSPTAAVSAAPPSAATRPADRPRPTARATFRGARSSCNDFGALRFPSLPASRREVDEISAIWKGATAEGDALRLRGAQASEAAFKGLAPGRRYLHLATHGFFIREDCVGDENPLLRGGLALAGANRRSAAAAEEEDGILTAEEVGALDLRGTEWAVLSACDTGLGDVRAGEGVLGLRRAFRVAGVKTTILSLWPVEDESVRQWMQALYREKFVRARPTAAAVHHATLDVLRSRRQEGLSTHPFHWAGFVATGDAR